MNLWFRGRHEQTVDAKGRVSVPARFIGVLQQCDPNWTEGKRPQLILVHSDATRNYIEGFSANAMTDMERKIARLPEGSAKRKMALDHYSGGAHETEVLEDGRIVLPQKLRNTLDLNAKALFIASGDTFRIWNPDVYQQTEVPKIDAMLAAQGEDFTIESIFAGLEPTP